MLTLYTKRFCPFCVRAKYILRSAGIEEYEEIRIDGREMELRTALMDLTGGRGDVPQAFVGDRYIGDDDALAALARSGELQRLLDGEASAAG